MKRNNLKFHNVPEQQNETRRMLISTIKHLLTEKLSINCDSILIDAYRREPATGRFLFDSPFFTTGTAF
ncbi:hypothetical protein DPMN_105596 [Dreissena polymorpha]|uniref:Uncharacterized protein n=1 Tax=Dreissena polymorpha TaxID=45954 RepID=A0A9D4K3G9_DREPO|nr:hypothetical protein DPMN_105596 [Dreissena polymorpha]